MFGEIVLEAGECIVIVLGLVCVWCMFGRLWTLNCPRDVSVILKRVFMWPVMDWRPVRGVSPAFSQWALGDKHQQTPTTPFRYKAGRMIDGWMDSAHGSSQQAAEERQSKTL